MDVKDVRVGADDSAGVPILNVYVKKAPYYAVYRTAERVMVHFADSLEERMRQQEVLASLNPMRSEIQSMIDGWRNSDQHDKQAMTNLFDRRIADALAMALEGDSVSGQALLKGALDEISEERQSRGRIEHLYWAGGTALLLIVVAVLLSAVTGRGGLDTDLGVLFFAGAVGAVGALVSIGIAVRERSLSTDLQTRDNIADAVLRVSVGAIGAVLLIAMFRSDFIDVTIGSVDLGRPGAAEGNEAGTDDGPTETAAATTPTSNAADAGAGGGGTVPPTPPADENGATGAAGGADAGSLTAGPEQNGSDGAGEERSGTQVDDQTTDLLALLVIAFFAGFTERLVSQLAERVRFREVASALPASGALAPAGGPTAGPRGGRAAAPPEAAVPEDAVVDEEGEVDGCVSDIALGDDEATDDSQLPPAEGGVEEARPA